MHWSCPVCKSPLLLTERTFSCESNHRFDKAKEGYVNLLLAHKKKSQMPGDNKAMLQQRRLFLEQGFYEPLAAQLTQCIQEDKHTTPNKSLQILDSGCGEGYYLNHIAKTLGNNHEYSGIDISKEATKLAAKRYKNYHFATASSYELPITDNSCDIAFRVFAPAGDAEIYRVLRKDGLYLWVHPNANHLFSLRELIYQDAKPHTVDTNIPTGFEVIDIINLSYPIHLKDASSLYALLTMTPYFWTASKEKQAQCQQLSEFKVNTDFKIHVLRKV